MDFSIFPAVICYISCIAEFRKGMCKVLEKEVLLKNLSVTQRLLCAPLRNC